MQALDCSSVRAKVPGRAVANRARDMAGAGTPSEEQLVQLVLSQETLLETDGETGMQERGAGGVEGARKTGTRRM